MGKSKVEKLVRISHMGENYDDLHHELTEEDGERQYIKFVGDKKSYIGIRELQEEVCWTDDELLHHLAAFFVSGEGYYTSACHEVHEPLVEDILRMLGDSREEFLEYLQWIKNESRCMVYPGSRWRSTPTGCKSW